MCSVENDMEIINTSTISLCRTHSFFNKPNESLTSTTENTNNYPCSQVIENPLNVLSDVMNDPIEAPLNVETETDASNCDAFVIAHSLRKLNDTGEELENIQPKNINNKSFYFCIPKFHLNL